MLVSRARMATSTWSARLFISIIDWGILASHSTMEDGHSYLSRSVASVVKPWKLYFLPNRRNAATTGTGRAFVLADT